MDFACREHDMFLEYVWVDAYGELRSKNRFLSCTLDKRIDASNDPNKYLPFMPKWNFDGSSTGQAPTIDSEIILCPVECFYDPFVKRELLNSTISLLVLCESCLVNGEPCKTNTRSPAKYIFDKKLHEEPWYGMEQEFFIIDNSTNLPYGFPKQPLIPRPQGPYYCSIGANNAFGRSLVSEAYRKCYEAGVKVSGMNGEVALGQWEIQVGPLVGIKAGDHVCMLRYILGRVSEEWSERLGKIVRIDYGSKPVLTPNDNWNGSGMHTNFSTKEMREDGGYDVILEAIKKLSHKHQEHILVYGSDNNLRLTGKNETSDPSKFTSSVGGRGTSIRIPTDVAKKKKGYFEDRRPSSSCDTYVVTSKIFETCCLKQ